MYPPGMLARWLTATSTLSLLVDSFPLPASELVIFRLLTVCVHRRVRALGTMPRLCLPSDLEGAALTEKGVWRRRDCSQ